MMKETGIIMSGSHPVDILEGRKTMTRRLWELAEINENPDDWELVAVFQDGLARFGKRDGSQELTVKCPYGGYGDRLWVKETWAEPFNRTTDKESEIPLYKADIDPSFQKSYDWKPSIFMPRRASRITLEITEIRAERLRAITSADTLAEGGYTVEEYIALFLRLNKLPEDADPFVWVIAFKRLERAVANNAVIREGIG